MWQTICCHNLAGRKELTAGPPTCMSTELRGCLALSYDELEEMNLKAKEQRKNHTPIHKIQEELWRAWLEDDRGVDDVGLNELRGWREEIVRALIRNVRISTPNRF
jgi:hypothetical protein